MLRAAKQYGVESRILDLATFDITHHPWRCGGFFDAIITDPPCQFSPISKPSAELKIWVKMVFAQARNG